MRLAPLARTLAFTLAAAGCASSAHADKAPPPWSPHVVLLAMDASLCGHEDKDGPCPPAIVEATKQALAASLSALAEKPIRCRGDRPGPRALHLYWGDGFGTVVHIDFDQERSGLPDCAGDLVQITTEALTERIRPIADKDPTLRVNWTVAFKLPFQGEK